ncbi:MAG: glycosyl hydrolase [Alphaproteobacteria bacterium]
MATNDPRFERLGAVLDLLAHKLIEDEARIGVEFPYVTDANGQWRTLSASLSAGYRPDGWTHGNWFCGFWVGLLVAAHVWTQEKRFLAIAEERMRLVAPRAADGNTHDIGFIFLSSALPLHHVTGEGRHKAIALEAADRLRSRLVATPRGAYLASWGPLSDPRGRCSSAIDTMANIPLLFWAAEAAQDASFLMAGEAHAAMTRNLVRPDHSTFHAAEYDTATGERRRGYSFQGWRDDSLWSRGQAWAIYGYAATAAATGKRAYLDLAEALAEHFLARLGSAPVPPYDFDDPDPQRPLDSAAAAIVASGLLDLAAIHGDAARSAYWRERAIALLDALVSHCLAREDDHRGLLKHGCYSWPHRDGVDSAVLFGDYYFVEALFALLLPGKLRPVRGVRLKA